MLLGSHISMSGKKTLSGTTEKVTSYGFSTFMIYIDTSQNTRGKAIEEMNIDAGKAYMAESSLANTVVHAPYITNLGNAIKPEMFPSAVQPLREETVRAEALGATQITPHPGVHVGAGIEAGIVRVIEGLNKAPIREQVAQTVLETMVGRDTEIDRIFEELVQVISGAKLDERLSVTFDTYHTNDVGYNIKEDFSDVMEELDKIIGLDRLKVFHIDDPKNPQGSYKDRHANTGFGTIGFNTLSKIVHDSMFDNISKISETPYVGKDRKEAYTPYGKGVAMFEAQTFDPEAFPELLAEEVIL